MISMGDCQCDGSSKLMMMVVVGAVVVGVPERSNLMPLCRTLYMHVQPGEMISGPGGPACSCWYFINKTCIFRRRFEKLLDNSLAGTLGYFRVLLALPHTLLHFYPVCRVVWTCSLLTHSYYVQHTDAKPHCAGRCTHAHTHAHTHTRTHSDVFIILILMLFKMGNLSTLT